MDLKDSNFNYTDLLKLHQMKSLFPIMNLEMDHEGQVKKRQNKLTVFPWALDATSIR